ncbi:MAG: NTP transferase domain-containing protein [Deltaproteobacteria bacterium]|nr:NTP transferase domain-containing protein [Deltaproteobacteria bacterium]MCB9786037.1 NTP transferase domain-containing protein [Deltaproteobacteria bacterium]
MHRVIAVILGGGQGARLKPLTSERAKPAVPFAGKYRLVDIPISNCLHAGIFRVNVLTQYQSASLHRHVYNAYRFDHFSRGYVNVLAAELTEHGTGADDWYQGTADAVRKMLHRFEAQADDEILILSGDQVYAMDLAEMVRGHRQAGADVTVAATRVDRDSATRFGVMRVDSDHWITEFAEKPKDDETLDRFVVPDRVGHYTHLASMGIYLFRASVLAELLAADSRDDFGKHILPSCIGSRRLRCHPFSGYWEDVGTIESYHRVNLELTDPVPAFNLFDEERPFYSRARFLPPAKIGAAHIDRAMLSDGSIIGDGAIVRRSVVGIRSIVAPGAHLDRVVMNGAGAYDIQGGKRSSGVPLGIGHDSELRNVIIDRDARVGANVRLTNDAGLAEYEDDVITVRDGIIVVQRQAVVPDGYSF